MGLNWMFFWMFMGFNDETARIFHETYYQQFNLCLKGEYVPSMVMPIGQWDWTGWIMRTHGLKLDLTILQKKVPSEIRWKHCLTNLISDHDVSCTCYHVYSELPVGSMSLILSFVHTPKMVSTLSSPATEIGSQWKIKPFYYTLQQII